VPRASLALAVGVLLAAAPSAHAFPVQPSPAAQPTPLKQRGGAAERARYERNAAARVSPADVKRFLPLYRRAARRYDVPWFLLAAIHKQETAFSTAEGTYHGLNWVGCCAGPMQFNVTNGPRSTWEQFRDAHNDAPRFDDYPHPTRKHPSVYDDFDAIMAAGKLLRANGATSQLDLSAWNAAYLYYGPGDLSADDFGITYANEVLARALNWARRGFQPDATAPRGLQKAVAARYTPAPAKKKHHKHKRKKHKRSKHARKVRDRELRARHRRRSAERPDRARRDRPRRREKDVDVRPDRPSKQPSGGQPEQPGGATGPGGPDAGGQPGGVGAGDGRVLPDGSGGPPVHGAAAGQGPAAAPAGDAPAADPGGPAQPGTAAGG